MILGLRGTFRCIAPDYPGFGLSRAADGYDFRPRSHSEVVEALVDRLGLEGIVVFGYAWGGPIGLGLPAAGRSWSGASCCPNTWAWPDDRLRVRLFSALMGGPLSPLLVDRLNLMLRLYLPFNLKRGRLTDAERAAYDGPFPPGEAVDHARLPARDRARAGLPARGRGEPAEAHRQAGHHHLAGLRPGFGDAELARWQALFPAAPTVILHRVGQFIDEDAPDDIAAALEAWLAAGMRGQA